MPSVTLVLDQGTGKLAGLSDADQRGWSRFLRRISELAGSCITFEWREPRSGRYHRYVFAQLSAVFGAQERFTDLEQFMVWTKTGAGFCEFLPHPERGLIAVPKSISYAKLDQAEFRPIADAMFEFLRSEHARRTLWPHLDDEQSFEMVSTILEEFA